jgi:hypothetical protein
MSEWKLLSEHPKHADTASRVLVYGPQVGVQPRRIYHYSDGTPPRGVAEGFNGDWKICLWQPMPDHPSPREIEAALTQDERG